MTRILAEVQGARIDWSQRDACTSDLGKMTTARIKTLLSRETAKLRHAIHTGVIPDVAINAFAEELGIEVGVEKLGSCL